MVEPISTKKGTGTNDEKKDERRPTTKTTRPSVEAKIYSAYYGQFTIASQSLWHLSSAHKCPSDTLFVQLLSPLLEVLLALRLGHVVRNGWAL